MSFTQLLKSSVSEINAVVKILDSKLNDFVKTLSEKLNIDEETLRPTVLEAMNVFVVDKKNSKKNKDDSPKKSKVNGYQLYSKENRDNVIRSNPGISFGEVGKVLGAQWKALSEEEKKPYNDRAAEMRNSSEPQQEEEKKEKKEKKATEKKEKKEKKEEEKEEKKEKKVAEKKEKKVTEKKDPGSFKDESTSMFNFKELPPVKMCEENKEFWQCRGIKIEGVRQRLHKKTGLIITLDDEKPELLAMLKNDEIIELDEVPKVAMEWAKKCGISVKEVEEEELEVEMDDDLEEDEDEELNVSMKSLKVKN